MPDYAQVPTLAACGGEKPYRNNGLATANGRNKRDDIALHFKSDIDSFYYPRRIWHMNALIFIWFGGSSAGREYLLSSPLIAALQERNYA
ncbi:MAG: hypothetical protein R3E61_11410 [Pseudomonadales bacterium]